MKTDFPLLKNLLATWFHMDWDYDFETVGSALAGYREAQLPETVTEVQDEARRALEEITTEEQARQLFIRLGAVMQFRRPRHLEFLTCVRDGTEFPE